jgi:putative hemolysin
VIEQFGYGMKIDHRGSRPIVIKDGWYQYYSSPGAGNLFLEDAEIDGFTIQAGQNVWARQLDDEAVGTKIVNLGGSLWILGLKTENSGTVINTATGGKTELLGALIYPAHPVPATDIAFQDTDAQVSYMYKESTYCAGCGYAIQILETRSGKARQITSSPSSGWNLPLFIGYTDR